MDTYDLLIVGGGINGCAIARDASIRGASVLLVEKDDLAGHTSSASSKLIHGGLRYLEYGQIRLVREALHEREILLRTAPHLVRPLRFVMPNARHMRPSWMIRAGLLAYDLLSARGSLPRSRRVWRRQPALEAPLKDCRLLLTYWDAWAEDSRLTVLNAVDAAENGAEIATRTALREAKRAGDVWYGELSDGRTVAARAIANAGGPWVSDVLARLGQTSQDRTRLVKGSHIVVPKLWDGDHAYILQQPDKRVVFALPFESEFTLIGTTDVSVRRPEDARISDDEIRYLCEAADRYFKRQLVPSDLVWCYSGIRALFDDGHEDAKAVTRDYHLELEPHPGPKLLSVFGGKITTARALAENAVDMLGIEGRRSTGWKMLPGGDLYPDFLKWLETLSEWLPAPTVLRMSRAYGTRLKALIGDASGLQDLGRHYGAGLYEREVQWLIEREYAQTADDILWRRSKLGLHMSEAEKNALATRMGG